VEHRTRVRSPQTGRHQMTRVESGWTKMTESMTGQRR